MKVTSYFISVLTTIALLITIGTGLGMRSLGIWAFQLHKIAGIFSVTLGIIMAVLFFFSISTLGKPTAGSSNK